MIGVLQAMHPVNRTVEDGLAQVGLDTNACSVLESRLEVHGMADIKLGLDKSGIRAGGVSPVFMVSGQFVGVITVLVAKL